MAPMPPSRSLVTISITDLPSSAFTKRPTTCTNPPATKKPTYRHLIYTTPPQPPHKLNPDPSHKALFHHQGYNQALEGMLLRLRDCPEGYACWTGMETFCDVRNGLRLELHEKMVEVVVKLAQMTQEEVARGRAVAEDVRAQQPGMVEQKLRETREEAEENGGKSTAGMFEEFVAPPA